jgi:hypothetical protein
MKHQPQRTRMAQRKKLLPGDFHFPWIATVADFIW